MRVRPALGLREQSDSSAASRDAPRYTGDSRSLTARAGRRRASGSGTALQGFCEGSRQGAAPSVPRGRAAARSEPPGPRSPSACEPRRAGPRRRQGFTSHGCRALGRGPPAASPRQPDRQGYVIFFLTRSSSPATAPAVASVGPERFLSARLRAACGATHAPALVTRSPPRAQRSRRGAHAFRPRGQGRAGPGGRVCRPGRLPNFWHGGQPSQRS